MGKKIYSNRFTEADLNGAEGVVFLFGEDDYTMSKIIKQVIKKESEDKKIDIDIVKIYGQETGFNDVVQELETLPLFTSKKLVIVKDFDRIKRDANRLADYISKFKDKDFSLIITANKVDFRKKSFIAIQKRALNISCRNPYSSKDVIPFIKKHSAKLGFQMDDDAVFFFSKYVNLDYGIITMELEKLFLLTRGETRVSREVIIKTIEKSQNYNIFQLQKSLGNKNLRQAMDVVKSLQSFHASEHFIIPLLVSFFTTILKINNLRRFYRDSEIEKNHLNEVFYMFRREYFGYANNFSRDKLLDIFDYLADVDISIKSTDTPMHILLKRMVYQISI